MLAAMAEDPITDVVLRLADTVGGLMELWGFRRALGRMWSVLYMSPEALTAQDLGDSLAMSAGTVSMTLAELLKWGVIKKTWRPGDRRDFYEPETSIWKPVSKVLRERELAQIRAAIESFEAAIVTLGRAPRARFVAERIVSLLNLAKMGEALLAAILEGKKIDPTPIKQFVGE
jgi:HTH-type transcriptional regulator, glycine betaine synthesis regulator